jgi:hypothetical protein
MFRTPLDIFDSPLSCSTTADQPFSRTASAVSAANLPRAASAAETSDVMSSAVRFRLRQGGAVRSQDVSAAAATSWPPRQARLAAAAAGAAMCSLQNIKSRDLSASDVNGVCVPLRRQLAKQVPRVHHAMQNSRPASFRGGGCSRRIGLVPPGRTTMLVKSASGPGLSTRAAIVRVSAVVREDTPVATVLPPVVETALGGARVPLPLEPPRAVGVR